MLCLFFFLVVVVTVDAVIRVDVGAVTSAVVGGGGGNDLDIAVVAVVVIVVVIDSCRCFCHCRFCQYICHSIIFIDGVFVVVVAKLLLPSSFIKQLLSLLLHAIRFDFCVEMPQSTI